MKYKKIISCKVTAEKITRGSVSLSIFFIKYNFLMHSITLCIDKKNLVTSSVWLRSTLYIFPRWMGLVIMTVADMLGLQLGTYLFNIKIIFPGIGLHIINIRISCLQNRNPCAVKT